jgi:CRP-like cAMP-binding protein
MEVRMRTEDCPILAELSSTELELVLNRAVPRRLLRGERLYVPGCSPGRVHFLRHGILKLMAVAYDGPEVIVGIALPGDLVGGTAAVDPGPHPLDAIAATDCELLGVNAQLLIETVCRNEGAARALARTLAKQLHWATETILERSAGAASRRLAGRLMHVSARVGHTRVRLTQKDLALLAGVSRESACRTLGRLKRDGVVHYNRAGLRVLRPDLLDRFRCARRAPSPLR